MKYHSKGTSLVFCILSTVMLGAPSTGTGQGEPLLLREAIQQSIAHNLGLQIERLEPLIAAENIEREEGAFGFNLFANGSLRRTELDGGNPLFRETDADNRSFSAGTSKLFSTGATITATSQLQRSDDRAFVGPSLQQDADVALSITQPLLQGRGTEVNLARLSQARAVELSARMGFRTAILETLRITELSYWALAYAHADRRFRESSLEVAERLLEEATQRESVGLATNLDVLQARASLAQRRDEIISAQQRLEDAEDRLMALLAELGEQPPGETQLNLQELPNMFSQVPEFIDVWQRSLLNNPATARQEAVIEQRRLDQVVARNQTLPELDLTVAGGYIGADDETGRQAYRSAFDRDGTAWEVRLEVRVPWGFRSERATLRQAERRLEQEEIRLIRVRQDLLEETRRQWRRLSSSHERLQTANLVLELQRLAFEQERGRYEAGLSTFRAVLEAQRDLDTATISELNSVIELLEAEVDLGYTDGSLLQRHGFRWDEME